jgi:sporulation protein YlmC with PRC-barrel domain
MTLLRLEDFEASSRRSLKEHELLHYEVYTTQDEKVGQVVEILVNEAGHFQYLVVDFNDGTTSKQVLLPLSEFQVDQTKQRVCVSRFQVSQVNELMTYNPTDNQITSSSDEEVASCSYPL